VRELLVDFITSLDGYASGEGWPGWWGLQGPDYLAWLEEQPEVTYLMGANTYRLMPGFAAGEIPEGTDEFSADRDSTSADIDWSIPSAPATAPATCPSSRIRASCTSQQPPSKDGDTRRPTSAATRLLPIPPIPVTVTRRPRVSSRRIS
jgi:hypothetical protein